MRVAALMVVLVFCVDNEETSGDWFVMLEYSGALYFSRQVYSGLHEH
jgi:hypothetical protein